MYCFFIAGKDSVNNQEALKNLCELSVLLTNPVPLSWLDFSGIRRGDDALLMWAVASERNTRSFIVERSLDGATFTSNGSILSMRNSNSINNYNFTDPGITNLGVIIIYYRIKQVDIDGGFTYSRVIAIRVDRATNEPLISAFPNPFSQSITLKVTPVSAQDKTSSIELYTLQGALVYKKEIGRQGATITTLNDLPELARGLYILKTIVNDTPYTIRMIKN